MKTDHRNKQEKEAEKKEGQTTKKPTPTRCGHDSFFKTAFCAPKRVRKLIELILFPEEKKAFDLNKLTLEKDTHEKKRADLVVSFPLKGCEEKVKLFIILEHKSYPDKGLFGQLLDYIYRVRKHSIKQYGYPQPVIPILFSHGRKPFGGKRTLQEADFGPFLERFPVKIRKNVLDFEIRVIDTKDCEIRKAFKQEGSEIGGFLSLLDKAVTLEKPSSKNIKTIITEDFSEFLKQKTQKEVKDLMVNVVEYLSDVAGLEYKEWKRAERELIEEKILKGGVMTVREVIEQKGREKEA